MKTKLKSILFILVLFTHYCPWAQNSDTKSQRLIDSLKRELKVAKHDTTKINLRFKLGEQYRITRPLFWDSLAMDAHKHNLNFMESSSLANVSECYRLKNDAQNFTIYANKSIKIAELYHYNTILINLYKVLGLLYVNGQELRKGLDICFKGLKIAEEEKDKRYKANFLSILGSAYWNAGDYNKSLNKHLECSEIYTELKDSLNLSLTLIDLGDTYEMLKDLNKASECYLKSGKFYNTNRVGDSYKYYVDNAVAAGYKLKKQYDSASIYLRKAYKIAESNKSERKMAGTLAIIADNSYLMGNNQEAKNQALRAMKFCEITHFTSQIPSLAIVLKKVYTKEKNYEEALKYYEMHVTIKDSLANEKNRKLASQKEFDYEFEKKENENKLLAQQNQIQALQLKQNNYFIWSMVALLTLILVIGFLFIRQNKFKAEQQSSQLEQKLLRSQMNPHFIFNSLQAIQNFILKHDEKEAVRYLSSFASVTRNVLENSRMELIPLKKEITLLENYLQLQKLRFKNRFDYEIDVDERIDSENMSIPPMLAQPFIENAVEHGFHDVEGDGKITVSFVLVKNQLLMEITDNGSGMKDGYAQSKNHQSLALEITKERVALMNKKAKEKVIFTIVEAFPQQEKRKGVKVTFHLPLNPTSSFV